MRPGKAMARKPSGSEGSRPDLNHRQLPDDPIVTLTEAKFLQKFRLSKRAVITLQGNFQNTILASCVLPVHIQLLTALRYYATGRVVRAAAVAGVKKSWARKIISQVSNIINDVLKGDYLEFPDIQQLENFKEDFKEFGQLINVIGCVSTVAVPLASCIGREIGIGDLQYGQKYLKMLVVCGPQGQITSLVVQSYVDDDWQVFQDTTLANCLHSGEYDGCLLVDQNYPQKDYFLTPIANPSNWIHELFNFAHFSTMQVSRHTLDVLGKRFPCMMATMDILYPSNLNVLMACGILHNLCLKWAIPLPSDQPHLPLSPPRLFGQRRMQQTKDREE